MKKYDVSVYENGSGSSIGQTNHLTNAKNLSSCFVKNHRDKKTSIGTFDYGNGTEIVIQEISGEENIIQRMKIRK